MTGRRHEIDSLGESYELFAKSVLSRIASLTHVGSKQDFGTDLYCLPRIDLGERLEAETELSLLQVKGGSASFGFGGTENNPAPHEINWLKSLWAPLYLVRVDQKYEAVEVFSTWAIWWVLWQDRTPGRIKCKWSGQASVAVSVPPPTRSEENGQNVWTVDLGPPFVRLTHASLNEPASEALAVDILRTWIRADRQTIARFQAWVPLVDSYASWATNAMPSSLQRLLAWDKQPGRNIGELAQAFVPTLLGLGVHLQWQDNVAAYELIPALKWVNDSGHGDGLTKGLLDGLLSTLSKNLTPMGSPRP